MSIHLTRPIIKNMDNSAVDLVTFLLNLLVYPAALMVPVLSLAFRKEAKTREGLRRILSLSGASALVLFSSSIQLFFNYIDLIQEFPGIVGEIIYVLLSQMFWSGIFLYIFQLNPFVSCLLKKEKELEKNLSYRIISFSAMGAAVVVLLLFSLILIPPLVWVESFLIFFLYFRSLSELDYSDFFYVPLYLSSAVVK